VKENTLDLPNMGRSESLPCSNNHNKITKQQLQQTTKYNNKPNKISKNIKIKIRRNQK